MSNTNTNVTIHAGDAAVPTAEEPKKPETAAAPQVTAAAVASAKAQVTEEQKAQIAAAIAAMTPEQIEALKAKAKAAGAEAPKTDAAGIIQPPNGADLPQTTTENDDGLPWWAWALIITGATVAGFGLGYWMAHGSNNEPDVQI